MYKKLRKTSKGLKILLVLALIFLALFIASFVVFGFMAAKTGDDDIKNFLVLFQYKINTFLDLFKHPLVISDTFNDAFNIGICLGLYGLAGLWVFFLIAGIVVGAKKKRGITALGIIMALLGVMAYLFIAAGSPKYLAIATKNGFFAENDQAFIPAIALLATGVIFVILVIILYFACVVEAVSNPKVLVKEAAQEEPQEEPAPVEEQPVQEETVKEENEEQVMFEAFVEEPQEEAPILEEPAEDEVIPEEAEEEKAPILEEPQLEEEYKEVKPQPQPQPERVERHDESISKSELAELIRSIVRDEMSHNSQNANPPQNNNNSAPIAANGPFVIQYFGSMPGAMPQPYPPYYQPYQPYPYPQPQPQPQPQQPVEEAKKEEPAPQEEPQPEPEPVKEEPAPVEEVQPEPVKEEPAPVVEEVEPVKEPEPAPAISEPQEKKPIIRISFQERMLTADEEMRKNYNELKNEILSYGVNSRVSNSGDAFRLHRKTYVKITIAGLSLKLYFALNPDDYKDSPIPVQNAGHKGIYAEIPLVFKVKSGLSMRRAKELIQAVMEQDGLEQGPIADTDWASELSKEADASDDE